MVCTREICVAALTINSFEMAVNRGAPGDWPTMALNGETSVVGLLLGRMEKLCDPEAEMTKKQENKALAQFAENMSMDRSGGVKVTSNFDEKWLKQLRERLETLVLGEQPQSVAEETWAPSAKDMKNKKKRTVAKEKKKLAKEATAKSENAEFTQLLEMSSVNPDGRREFNQRWEAAKDKNDGVDCRAVILKELKDKKSRRSS